MSHSKNKKPITPLIEQLRDTRRAIGISQHELAHRIGYNDSVISYWETGRYRPRPISLAKWCEALGIKP